MNRQKLRHVKKSPLRRCWSRYASLEFTEAVSISTFNQVSPISSSIRLATSSVTRDSVRRQRVDFSQRILMAALLPDASPFTEENGKAAFLKHDRSVAPLVR
jgi:hypothetical protein